MKFFRWLTGIQLLIGALWNLYFNQYVLGLPLLLIAFLVLLPLVYKLLKVQLNSEFKAWVGVILLAMAFILPIGIEKLVLLLTIPDLKQLSSLLSFEKNLSKSTKACFGAYDVCFSKSQEARNNQCSLIIKAKDDCKNDQLNVVDVPVPGDLSDSIKKLLSESKIDAQNALKSTGNVYEKYARMCNGEKITDNGNSIKFNMVMAMKDKYLMDLKLKKARSSLGL